MPEGHAVPAARTRLDGDVAERAASLGPAVAAGRRLVVAAVMDPFTRLAFDPECTIVDLHAESWREELEGCEPDLLFVESAWRGDQDSWYDTIQHCPQELVDIAQWCRDKGVPSVFWNKEDPVYYNRFIKAARLFDHVFTTDVDVIARYVNDLGHSRVHVLPFAAQPMLCNPVETDVRRDAAVFAGSYYQGFKDRNKALFAQIEGTSRVIPVEIYDRNFGTENPTLQWPDPYDKLVVGTLPADQIDVAYKGYRVALNVNTVTSSQSMLARRVFDLLASATPTVSNFSPSLKVLFGDLVAATDSADEIEAAVRAILDDPDGTDKKRAMGLRHVMRAHTYAARFRQVVETLSGVPMTEDRAPVVAVALAHTSADLDRWRDAAAGPSGREVELFVVSDDAEVLRECVLRGVPHAPLAEARTQTFAELVPGAAAVLVLRPEHWYGPHYIGGLADALTYSEAGVVTKATRFVPGGAGTTEIADAGAEYRLLPGGARWHRSLVRWELCQGIRLDDALADADALVPDSGSVLGIDRFDFAEHLAAPCEARPELSAQLPLHTGAALESLLAAEPGAQEEVLPDDAFPRDRVGTAKRAGWLFRSVDEGVVAAWSVPGPGHTYIPFSRSFPVNEVAPEGVVHLRMHAELSGLIAINISWLDADGTKIAGTTYKPNVHCSVRVPEDATEMLLFFRVAGTGTALIPAISIAPHGSHAQLVLDGWTARTLVVTNIYPDYDSPYQNGFIHTRLRCYRDRGENADVFLLREGGVRHREFHGFQVLSGNEVMLRAMLESGEYDHVAVHFLNERMWSVLREYLGRVTVTVWVHGFEIEPWWRRMFNYTNAAELEAAKQVSAARMEFWRGVSQEAGEDVSFVFVSKNFRAEVAEDQATAGFGLDERSVHIVHNPIDADFFAYTPKDPEQRKHILLIRPFVSKKYANDLAVAAIEELAAEPWFDELTITVFGDGPLFDEETAPLVAHPNVTVERRFLLHAEIAELHREHGVFLVPTRHDTQGVSRDEAMSSGLVPVTSDIPTIREFLSEEEGYLAPDGDASGLADAIREMYHHPEIFLAKSAAAAERIRRTIASDIVIPQEIALLRGQLDRTDEGDAR